MVLSTFSVILVILATVFYVYSKRKYSYWSEKNVRGPKPWPIVGNFANVMLQRESVNQCLKNIHLKYKGEKLVGLYRGFQPILLVRDPELIKYVLIKDFNHFPNRGMSMGRSRLNDNLFGAEGEKWKIMRQKLTPLYTTLKLKKMIPIMLQCVDDFIEYVSYLVENNYDHEIRALTSKYTMKVIELCAFGLDVDTFYDENNEFSVMAKRIFRQSMAVRLLIVLDMIIPGIRKMFKTSTDVEDFFVGVVRKVIKERESKPLGRNDFIDLMIELREQGKVSSNFNNGENEIEIDDYMLAAQAFVFYSAGYETSSATMSFLIYELALNLDVQDHVYQEISTVLEKNNGELNYDTIKEMKYLEMVIDETLRKYTVAGILFRKSISSYTFPGTDVKIPKGTLVLISPSGLNEDPEYFSNPNKFDPENFSAEKLVDLPQCVYMPFGDGPRNCIGMRFGKIMSLLGLAAFLKSFKVEPSAKTEQHLTFNPKAIILTSKEGIWVKISKR